MPRYTRKPPTPRAGYGPHCRVKPVPTGWHEPDAWQAYWHEQRAPATFQSEGAARAYLATCDVAGKLRS